jgi:hypothetical protein
LLNTTASWKVVHWDCSNVGPPKKLNRLNGHTVLASLSANSEYTSKEWDQGLAFPRYRSYDLSTSQRRDIMTCQRRPLLLYFSGHLLSRPRRLLQTLHNGKDILIGTPRDMIQYASMWRNDTDTPNESDSYFALALASSFCAIPRGQAALGSSRLLEMMSAGCIPVLLADDWVLPSRLAIPWNDIAIHVPEREVLHTVSTFLRNISEAQQCTMRMRMIQVYDDYLSTERAIVKGLVDGLQQSRVS